jgi:predicted deacylase
MPPAAAVVLALVMASGDAAGAGQGWSAGQPARAGAALNPRPLVVDREQIGTSVQGRAIYAYHLGDAKAVTKAVVVGQMHGDEMAGVRVARAIIRGDRVFHVDLWVVPTMNPDGLAADTRQNAHGVDLNRNWAHKWVHMTGRYNSGKHPFSEPESRAMRHLLNTVDPTFIVSLHQPLDGVDSDQPKNVKLMHRLSKNLDLPEKPFTCGGVCHGTMTGWFNARHDGACITVEFGSSPGIDYLRHQAAHGVVISVLGHYHTTGPASAG